jgi:hypothetical protein
MALGQDPFGYSQTALESGVLGILFQGLPCLFNFEPGHGRLDDTGTPEHYDGVANPLFFEKNLGFQEFKL